MIMRWVDIPGPFLGNGLVNTFMLPGSRFLIMHQLDSTNGRAVFSMWSVLRGYKRDKVWSLVSSVQESVKRGLELEAEE
jgi:hypothetical protein